MNAGKRRFRAERKTIAEPAIPAAAIAFCLAAAALSERGDPSETF
jgi:hypothetical protein